MTGSAEELIARLRANPDDPAAFADLRERGLVYPAYETREELREKREAQRRNGLPPRYEIPVIGGGFVLVALAVPALALVLGSGPVWVIALVGALDGAGFGMAWTYLMKRMTENQDAAEGNRIAGAMSTISRMGYALGAGLTGLAANLAGFADVMDPTTARSVAFWIFAALVPVALGGLSALALFVVRSRA